ncbi:MULTISPECIES: hypothetical protein [Rhizobium]|uniref:Secreted protein n=1 Tax=Rhizobium favelukesii TaxID=348824 RepID=W6RKY2_9HYPH|nr:MULTISPECIES: hypothetical protein [Rhizobium]MCA0803574.1 hypothetical protein [Rhizobium sp. T1473]MCS0461656.1 hypothetical protein [Rhizobium favelukesii]UFS82841.1 hypothetical protein LPB79_11200 [Rhizobium sp. T136]CDM59563.1 hypothetical protein LPU83_3927 [Rhizobium favelukesii]
MLKTLSMLVSLAAAALIALPTSAGDFGQNSFSRHGGKQFMRHHAPTIVGRPFRGWNDGRVRFSDGYGRFGHRPGRAALIKRASWPYRGYNGYSGYGGRNVIILVQPQPGGGVSGTYSGSSYVYDADGGTYVASSGYGFPAPQRTTNLAPMAKVINVTAKSSSCSYEAGVCVIRP